MGVSATGTHRPGVGRSLPLTRDRGIIGQHFCRVMFDPRAVPIQQHLIAVPPVKLGVFDAGREFVLFAKLSGDLKQAPAELDDRRVRSAKMLLRPVADRPMLSVIAPS